MADIHIAIGSADGQLPAALQMCCPEKIAAPHRGNAVAVLVLPWLLRNGIFVTDDPAALRKCSLFEYAIGR